MVEQPLDWKKPAAGTFGQRVVLMHVGYDRPTVVVTQGYGAGMALPEGYRDELSKLLDANIVFVEHRYFDRSRATGATSRPRIRPTTCTASWSYSATSMRASGSPRASARAAPRPCSTPPSSPVTSMPTCLTWARSARRARTTASRPSWRRSARPKPAPPSRPTRSS